MIYPAIALYAKRWHDRGKSGWWSLIGLVPIIGGMWMLIELGFLKGTAGRTSTGRIPFPPEHRPLSPEARLTVAGLSF